jgi:hypothetical protein
MKHLMLTSMIFVTVAMALVTINPRSVSAQAPDAVGLAVFHLGDKHPVIGTATFTPLTEKTCEAALLLYGGFSYSRKPDDYSFIIGERDVSDVIRQHLVITTDGATLPIVVHFDKSFCDSLHGTQFVIKHQLDIIGQASILAQ